MNPWLREPAGPRSSAPALADDDRELTYSELEGLRDRWAAAATAHGCHRGEVVIVRCDSPVVAVTVLCGLWAAGAVPLVMDPTRTDREVLDAVATVRARTVATDRTEPPGPADTLVSDPGGARIGRLCDVAPAAGTPAPPVSGEPVRFGPEGDGVVLYTSGTTGTSKCILWSSRSLLTNARTFAGLLGLSAGDRILTPIRPEETSVLVTLLLPALLTGGAIRFTRYTTPGTLAGLAERSGTTVLCGAPFTYELFARSRAGGTLARLPALRTLLVSGGVVRPETMFQIHELSGIMPTNYYGSSETGLLTYNDSPDPQTRATSVGRAVAGVKLELEPVEGATDPTTGCLIIRSDATSSGYLDRPELQAKVFRDGTVTTNDLATIRADGYVFLLGRLSETVNRAGHLVNPAEVGAVLAEHPAVAQATVQAEPDTTGAGERLVAYAVADADVTAGELVEHCRRALPSWKVPSAVHLVPELRMTRSGKVARQRPPG